MSKHQEHISRFVEFTNTNKISPSKQFIRDCIKHEFQELLPIYDERMKLYQLLSNKYGYSRSVIIRFCNE